MKDPLAKQFISLTGDFGDSRSHLNLRRWIETNGGTFSSSINATVTHLICSKLHWKAQNATVKAALKHKNIKIVSYDWLEDSLMDKTRKNEVPYLWTTLSKSQAGRKEQKKTILAKVIKKEVTKFQKGQEEAVKDIHSENHHFYRDDTCFQYDITLTRPDLLRNWNERHQLRIYENNHGPPFLYACTTTYSVPGRPPLTISLAPMGSQFFVALAAFKRFFRLHTGVDWDFRLWNRQAPAVAESATPSSELSLAQAQLDEQCKLYNIGKSTVAVNPNSKNFFVYLLPNRADGQPLGDLGLAKEGVRRFGQPQVVEEVGGGHKPTSDEH